MKLSEAISALVAAQTPENWQRFGDLLVRAELGVVALGVPPGTTGAIRIGRDQPIGLGRTHRAGMNLILTCADPEVYRQRYPNQGFNAQTDAMSVFDTVLANADCDGLLINSAASEHSVPLRRAQVQALVDALRS